MPVRLSSPGKRLVPWIACIALGLWAAPPAARAADAEAGGRLVAQWCQSCHLVEQRVGRDQAPPLAAIANNPALSDGMLRAWLADPHPPMPNLSLTTREIDDIVAYLRTLKRK